MFASINATNNSDNELNSFDCTYTGSKDKDVWLSDFESYSRKLQPGASNDILVKIFNIVDDDSHVSGDQKLTMEDVGLLKEIDESALYCAYTGGLYYE